MTDRITKTWQEEAAELPPPSEEEIAEYAEGIVSHVTEDGTRLRFDLESRRWERAES